MFGIFSVHLAAVVYFVEAVMEYLIVWQSTDISFGLAEEIQYSFLDYDAEQCSEGIISIHTMH